MKIPIDEIVCEDKYYPREKWDNETVNQYRANIDALPPIIVQKADKILIDGKHRLLAHRLAGTTEIEVEFMDIPKEQILWEAAKLNASFGRQLSLTEKAKLSRDFYVLKITEAEIAKVLCVSIGKVSDWVSELRKERDNERDKKILDMFLHCMTERDIELELIEAKEEISDSTIHRVLQKFKDEILKQPPIPDSLQVFNVWDFHSLDSRYGLKGTPGQIPGQIVENLLYYYTNPFDTIVDPMAGGGTTKDVCKTMKRRWQAYDINPLYEEIEKWDIREGFPKKANNCDLIFLDPPYYDMVSQFGKFFNGLDDFYSFIAGLAKSSRNTVREGGHVALLMSDQTKGEFECLSNECYGIFKEAKLKPIMRVSCPLTTNSANGGEVDRAKKNKKMLGRDRVLYVFRRT